MPTGGARRATVALAAAIVLSGCVRREPVPPARVYPYSSATAKVFYATSSGLSEMTYEGEAEPELLASKAPNASVLSANGTSIAVAVNGWGIESIESSSDASSYRIVDRPEADFAGCATGGIWPRDGGYLVHLYRDPFADWTDASGSAAAPTATAGTTASSGPVAPGATARLMFFGAAGDAARPNPLSSALEAGFEPFVLLPSDGHWFAQLRKDAADRVDMKFYAIDDPLAATPIVREIRRSAFEAALKPLPLADLGGAPGTELRSALGALGKGPWLARLRSSRGDDRWYLSSGKPEEATNVYAWSMDGADPTVLALTPDGRLAIARSNGAPALSAVPAPAEGAAFTALTAVGSLAAASWESGVFPYISSAGIVLRPLR